MKKIISAVLVGSMALGGLSIAITSGDYNDHRGGHHGKYCKQGGEGKYEKGHHKKGIEHRMQRMMKHLELSEEQATKVRSVFDKHSEQLSALRTEKMSNRQALRASMHADNMDMAVIEKLAKKQGTLKTEKILVKAKIKSEINAILTDEQRAKKKEMRGKRGHGEHNKHDRDY